MNPSNVVERIVAPISAAAVSVFVALAVFAAPPVALTQQADTLSDGSRVLQWLTFLSVGGVWVLYLRRPSVLRRWFGLRFIGGAAVASLLLVAAEHVLTVQWTVEYAPSQGFRLVVGETLTEAGLNRMHDKGCLATDALCIVKGFAGDSRLAWQERELAARQRSLLTLRVAAYASSLLALLAICFATLLSRPRSGAQRGKAGGTTSSSPQNDAPNDRAGE